MKYKIKVIEMLVTKIRKWWDSPSAGEMYWNYICDLQQKERIISAAKRKHRRALYLNYQSRF